MAAQAFLVEARAVRRSQDFDREIPPPRAKRGSGHGFDGHPVVAAEPRCRLDIPAETPAGNGEPRKLLECLLGLVIEVVRSALGGDAQEVTNGSRLSLSDGPPLSACHGA